jgi:hypothetical protein
MDYSALKNEFINDPKGYDEEGIRWHRLLNGLLGREQHLR